MRVSLPSPGLEPINVRRFTVSLAAAAVSLAAGVSHADPFTTILGLAAADKVMRADKALAAPTPWRARLTKPQRNVLQGMRHHPAIGACITAADGDDAVAAYNLRKIAELALDLRGRVAHSGALPKITAVDYQWPARAFRWCSRKAGGAETVQAEPLEHYAQRVARLAVSPERNQRRTAYQSD